MTSDFVVPGYAAFLGSEFEHPAREHAFFHVLPVPLESSVSYGGGTAAGAAAILAASWQLEAWDKDSIPGELGIHTQPPVDVTDDVELVLAATAATVATSARAGHMPVVLGGEHTITDGAVQGLLDAGLTDIGIVQIDAHADLRDSYKGNRRSHATVMRRVVERGLPLFQLGVRELCEEERAARVHYRVQHLDAHRLVPEAIGSIELPDTFPSQVYISIDVDGLDPSVLPATGTPVPGGPGWYQTISLLESVARQRRIIGFDVVEFAPMAGFHAWDFAAALLVHRMMGIVQRNRLRKA